MQEAAEADVDRVLHELEGDSAAGRRNAVLAAVRLGERAVRTIPLLQRMATDEVIPELRHLARKALHLLAQEAHAKAQANQQQQQVLTVAPGGKSAKITQELAKESIPVVAAKLNSSNPHVRASALRATAMRGERLLLPALLERIGPEREPDAELRAIQVRVLAILGGKEQLKGVAAFLEDPDPICRTAAVDVLAQFRDVMAFPYIVRALQDQDPRPQQRAATALAKVGPVNILKICEMMGKSDRAWSRDAATFCLALTALPDSAPLLVELLKDPEESVRRKARAGLEKLAEKGVEPAKEALARTAAPAAPEPLPAAEPAPVVETQPAADIESREPVRRRAATKQLVALDGALDERHLPGILRRLDAENDVLVLVNLLTAIGRIRSASVVPQLAKSFVTHPDESVRAATVNALAALGVPEALEPIRPLLEDTSPVVIGRSLVALRAHAGVDLVAELTAMASHPDTVFRTTAIYVITELEDERLVPIIEKLGRDSDPAVASLAQDSGEILAEDLKAKALAAKTKLSESNRVPTRPSVPVARPSGSTTRPSKPANAPSGSTPRVTSSRIATIAPPTSLKVPAALLALGGVGWMGVAAWSAIQTGQLAGAAGGVLAGLGGLGAGYGLLKNASWSRAAGMGVAALQLLLGLLQVAFGRPAALALALVALVGGALVHRARASFEA